MVTSIAPTGHVIQESVRTLRMVLPQAGFGIPAAMLDDPEVACWAASRCVTVFAGSADHVRYTLSSGVMRFVALADQDLGMLSRYGHRTTGPAESCWPADRRV